jgi:hypothetical protein
MPFKRISVTIPASVLAAADRRARELGRSRSWVVAQAIRQYTRAQAGVVREPEPVAYAVAEVAEARRRRLVRDLELPADERLRQAEELAQLGREQRARAARRHQVIGFDSYEDFYEWKKARHAGA